MKNKIRGLERKVDDLSNFIIDDGLAEKFRAEKFNKSMQKNREIGRDFSR